MSRADDDARAEVADAIGVWIEEGSIYGGFGRDGSYFTARVAPIIGKAAGEVREVHIGNFASWCSQQTWRVRIALEVGVERIRGKRTSGDWDSLLPDLKILFRDADDAEAGEAAQLAGFLVSSVYRECVRLDGASGSSRAGVYADDLPFVESDHLHVHLAALHKALLMERTPVPTGKLLSLIKGLGFERAKMTARTEDGGFVGRRYWRLALADLQRHAGNEGEPGRPWPRRVVEGEP